MSGSFSPPDFSTLFPADAVTNSGWVLTPRTACALWMGAQYCLADATDDLRHLEAESGLHDDTLFTVIDDCSFFSKYPPITWREDVLWWRHAVASYRDQIDRLAAGRIPYARSTAEEMTLWLSIEAIEDAYGTEWETIDAFPEHPRDSWGDLQEFLYQDHDFLSLFNRDLTGIEDPDHPMHEVVPGVIDMRPIAWFDQHTWFGDEPDIYAARPSYREAAGLPPAD